MMERQQQIDLLKRLLHFVETRTTSLADAPWRNDVSVYADSEHLAREQQILFRRHPILMGFASEWATPGAFRTDFLSAHSIRKSGADSAYAANIGKITAAFDANDGKQIGDPDRGAQAIIAAVAAETPPLHLLLGSDALRRAREKLDAVIEEIDRWEDVTRSTDYPQAAA